MPMIDGSDRAHRGIVRDRLGRRLSNVVACNPETGEVIRWDSSHIVGAILRAARGREQHWDLPAEFCRHGFWPAPLTIEPRQWLHIGMD